jgi:hypothetical protein
MPRTHPPFGRILIAAILAQALLMAVTLVYMLAYSRFIAPGRTSDSYLQHAGIAAPVISIVAGAIIFFLLAQWLGKQAIERRTLSAVLFWLVFVLISGGVAIALFGLPGYQADAPITAVAHVVKLVAALFGARASVGVRSIAS